RAPRARSRHGRRCGGQQAPRPRPGAFDTDRRALMAGGDPHRAGRSPAGVRPAPLPGDDPQAAFEAIAAAADIGDPWQVKTEFGPFMYPAEIAPDGAFMRAVNGGGPRPGLPPPPAPPTPPPPAARPFSFHWPQAPRGG